MIWESTTLMTVFDLAIVSISVASLLILLRSRSKLVKAGLSSAASIVVIGLITIGLFYLADLLTMFALPLVTERADAASAMEHLHLNYSWPMMLFSVVCIFIGFGYINRRLLLPDRQAGEGGS